MKIFIHRNALVVLGLLTLGIITIMNSCKPEVSNVGLGALPKPDFTYIVDPANPNHLTLINKTGTPSIPYWSTSAGASVKGDSAKVSFIFAGNYTVTLYAVGQGGLDSVTKTVVMAQNDPTACLTPLGFVAGCTSRTWKLEPKAGALQVGPSGPGDGSWWGNAVGDTLVRYGDFDDRYTFSFNANNDYNFNDNNTFFSDNYLAATQYASLPDKQMFPTCTIWQSGNFKYNFIPNAGVKGLGQIQLIGLGAHLALAKVTNAAETTVPTATSVTYDITATSTDVNGVERIQLAVHTCGTEWWTFNLIAIN